MESLAGMKIKIGGEKEDEEGFSILSLSRSAP